MEDHDKNLDIHLVTVHTLDDAVEAELIKNVLINEGIHCAVDGEHQGGFTGTLSVGILVRETDREKAQKIIDGMKHS